MGLGNLFKSSENEQLKAKIEEMETSFNVEKSKLIIENQNLKIKVSELEKKVNPEHFARLQSETARLNDEIKNYNKILSDTIKKVEEARSQLTEFDNQLELERFGLYKPRYDFAKSEQYLVRLEEIRRRQKDMILNNTAVLAANNWNVNGSAAQGKKMIKDMQKLLLRAFNGECDELVAKVKYNNFEMSLKRINASCDAISKLGAVMQISISSPYRQAKIDELTLAFEYAQKKQREKEDEKEAREALREEARLQKEIEEERRRLEKEQNHYQNALERLNRQLAENPNNEDLKVRQQTLIEKLEDTEKAIKDVDYREANKKAGYVYVISNVGAFGENVYKIGMTRRLNPQDRIDELGDASVPFKFDVHAMIFSDDAPKLEAALHRAFENKKLNMVNPRREFFKVTLSEIKQVIYENYDKTVEFTDIPDAEQWRISLKMRGETPQESEPIIHSVPSQTLSQKNLAQRAIEIIGAKSRNKCTYTEKDGIFSVTIENCGRMRISNRGRIKCDFFGKNGKVAFFDDINKICNYI